MDNKDQTNSNSSRRRRIALGVFAFLVVAAIIVIPTCFATLRPETVPVVETRAEESLPSLIKAAPIGATGGAILIEYTELLEDNSTVFYYLTVRDLDFTTLEGVADASNLALYLTSAAEPTADDVLKTNLSVRLRHRRDLLAIDEDNAIRIGLVTSIDFPFRLPDSFLPGNFNGALFIEENPEENNEASNTFVKTVSSASFTAIVDPERNIGSSTSAVTTTSSQPTQSPSRSPTDSPTATVSAVPTATPTPESSATVLPSRNPTAFPTTSAPSQNPTTESPTAAPTRSPTGSPSSFPTRVPSPAPTFGPTARPSLRPTAAPSPDPTAVPTRSPQPTVTGFTPFPTATPSFHPTNTPTLSPTRNPTSIPTGIPTKNPTRTPSSRPTEIPSVAPTRAPEIPTTQPSTKNPTSMPSPDPTKAPTAMPSTKIPTKAPTTTPSSFPTDKPTVAPTEALVDPASSQLPPLLFSDINGSYGIDGSINIDYVQDFRNGAIVDVARLRFDIPNLSNAPGPYLYLSKRPFSETRNGGLSDEDIFVPIDSGSEGQFNVKGRFDQFLDEIASVQDLQEYANGSWIVWCRPFGVWIGGGDISAV